MFPNDVMMEPETWNDILAAMIAVRDATAGRSKSASRDIRRVGTDHDTPRCAKTSTKINR